ncbi:hypothetical protein QVD17_39597 [Tagetes erecta]|uniref:Uncharacterized protein n=1 Tax=Tagetes erecta TaxID=13708 RepID=A0AAD8JR31_TARER|nr:hypothetical protein QVD17_39597 [Tagetes erecta]
MSSLPPLLIFEFLSDRLLSLSLRPFISSSSSSSSLHSLFPAIVCLITDLSITASIVSLFQFHASISLAAFFS